MAVPSIESHAPQQVRIGNLPESASESDVRRLFSTIGTIIALERPVDHRDKAPKWSAYVTLAPAVTAKAVQTLHGRLLNGEILSASVELSPRA